MAGSDMGKEMDKLLSFLGWTLTAEERTQVLQLASFDWMSRNEEKFIVCVENPPASIVALVLLVVFHFHSRRFISPPQRFRSDGMLLWHPRGFIREGKVGRNRERLSEEQRKRIYDKCRSELPEDLLEFLSIPKV